MPLNAGLIDTFEKLPGIVADYVARIPDADRIRSRGEGIWPVKEHIYHIAGVQEMLYGRMVLIRDRENPVITPYFPQNEGDRGEKFPSVEKALAHYAEYRKKQLTLIGELRTADLEREARHEEYTQYTIPLLINHMVFHEYWHMYRIEEIWLTRDGFFAG
jgi:hypothetical protein